ncbi:uncharacterized protein LOC119721760 [Patiria miniata]|uniref:Uncharacterized protein n=1 Tax=Patiria miniata TaxID=46514 RepID=A0A913Z7I5_PATMI|nr:uncharacterized protein LOC119721760 [Patiria miniata]
MGSCCSGEDNTEKEPISEDSGDRRGPVTSDQARSKYVREKLKAKEERQPLLPSAEEPNNDRSKAAGHGAITDPREVAHIRREKLREAEVATEKMKSGASIWKKTAALLARR